MNHALYNILVHNYISEPFNIPRKVYKIFTTLGGAARPRGTPLVVHSQQRTTEIKYTGIQSRACGVDSRTWYVYKTVYSIPQYVDTCYIQ